MKFVLTCLALAFLVSVSADGPTPTQKVVELLGKLSKKVIEEGELEKKQFAEYAKFCEKTIDEKKYGIGVAEQALEGMTSNAEVLSKDAESLGVEIGELNTSYDALQEELAKLEAAREKEVTTYMDQAKEMHHAIKALGKAIETLRASKDQLVGEVALFRIGKDAKNILNSATKVSQLQLTGDQIEMLADLSEAQPKAATYKGKTGDIVAMLEGMLSSFKVNKQELDMAETKNKGAYSAAKMNLQKQLTFTNRERSDKKLARMDKKEKNAMLNKEIDEAVAAKNAETAFLAALEEDCQSKADIAKQRTEMRNGEIKALKLASDKIKESVGIALVQRKSQGFSVQTQTVKEVATLRQDTAEVVPATEDTEEEAPAAEVQHKEEAAAAEENDDENDAPSQQEIEAEEELGLRASDSETEESDSDSDTVFSFLQLRGSAKRASGKVRRMSAKDKNSIIHLLTEKASLLQSSSLTATAVRVMREDNFVEVRAVLAALLKKMRKSAKEEANTKKDCDEMITKHSKNRDDSIAFIETKQTFVAATESELKKLTMEVKRTNEESSKMTSELEEASALRAKEKSENERALVDARAGEKGTAFALDVLKKFYDQSALVQESSSQPSTDVYSGAVLDSSGNSLADMAPTVATEEYNGDQEGSGGVLGMLDVLHSDFVRTIAQTEAAEKKSEDEFSKMKSEAEKELESNSQELQDKNQAIANGSEDLGQAQLELKRKQEELTLAQDELSKLRGMCTQNEESYEAGRAKRQAEIESLQDAIEMINSLLALQEER
eukprot:TRINITY_DN96851_c0_g1_i1.p1 TRINITY_DN96851_c0_g1~~TRINITY_DN96851_c0_g1_i1.p1  ORF type:complete len:782 (-),score=239.98 TRINITY_DN96851_c0_g1_i1:247-2592(-)